MQEQWVQALRRHLHSVTKSIPTVPYSDGYFLEEAKKFRTALKMPLVYVGGLTSKAKMEEVLDAGFTGLQMARALVHDTDFVNKLRTGQLECSGCRHSNYCIGRMYTLQMRCHHCVDDLPEKLRREIEKSEYANEKSNKNK